MDGSRQIGNTVLETDLDKLAYNVQSMKRYAQTGLMAVVKADAYGLGIEGVCGTIIENGVDYLAVATIGEALRVRNVAPDFPVLVFGIVPDFSLGIMVDKDITSTITDLRQAQILSELAVKAGKKAKIHIKVNTGMNRLGFEPTDESLEIVKKIVALPGIDAEGIYSHLVLMSYDVHKVQFDRFMEFVGKLESDGIRFRYRHISDSVATVMAHEFALDLCRIGCHMFGIEGRNPEDREVPIDMKQVVRFTTRVCHLHDIEPGEGVSYGHRWIAQRPTRIATIGVGYADGYSKLLEGKPTTTVTIRGKAAPVVGVICMDQCMVDVTDIPDVEVGDEVVLFGDGPNEKTFFQAGEDVKNNPLLFLVGITSRVERRYVKGGK